MCDPCVHPAGMRPPVHGWLLSRPSVNGKWADSYEGGLPSVLDLAADVSGEPCGKDLPLLQAGRTGGQ
jgi:hypothetical protein